MTDGAKRHAKIMAACELYLDGIYAGDVEKLRKSMHPDCRMICQSQGQYLNIGMSEYFSLVADRVSPKDLGESRMDQLVSITALDDEVAVVNLRCLVLGKYCSDSLTLIHDEDGWRVISKVFSYSLCGKK